MSIHRTISVVIAASLGLILIAAAKVSAAPFLTVRGSVESGESGLEGYKVSLLATFVGAVTRTQVLGRGTTGGFGEFEIHYGLPAKSRPILFILAEKGSAMLASAIGRAPLVGPVVINELTTVATGFAFAQFVDGKTVKGNRYGMLNAVHMAANMAHPETGTVAAVLRLPPNGPETAALRTFNSLANIVASCIAAETGCEALFDATTLPGGPRPTSVLQAVANIAKYPWLNVATLFDLSFEQEAYGPALAQDQEPDAWTLILKFTGSFSSVQDENNLMNAPGAFAIDRKGFLWASNNYVPQPPEKPACAGTRLLKFYPWGESFPGSPYFGGGISGSGWGIQIAPNGRIWVSNFGFAGTGCPEPPANSISLFRRDGTPISPDAGFTAGPISWPQGAVADRGGNIWIANCESDSVTYYPNGRPGQALNFAVPGVGPVKPFGVAIDHEGNAWVTGSFNSTLAVYGPAGDLIELIPTVDPLGVTQLRRPMGIASDSQGNIWVANSDWMDVPCPPGDPDLGPGTNPSIALFHRDPDRQPDVDSPFTGGGLTLPWGIAVDGNDTVWVANFGFPFDLRDPDHTESWEQPNRVSHFCGVDISKCPLTKQGVGVPISPDGTGYTSDALIRNTAVAIDPSGNVWLANNWKEIPLQRNPGGNSIVVLIGAAAPLKTPLIGTPRLFDRRFVER
jgi:DNA-binding beta-propeller fold protein YncE